MSAVPSGPSTAATTTTTKDAFSSASSSSSAVVAKATSDSSSSSDEGSSISESPSSGTLALSSSVAQFRQRSNLSQLENYRQQLAALVDSASPSNRPHLEVVMADALSLFERFLRSRRTPLEWEKISLLPEHMICLHKDLESPPTKDTATLLSKLAVLKLNGGLGTTMGCTGPKSAVEVRNQMSFLDLTVRQIQHLNSVFQCQVPLLLMNSFNTHTETMKIVRKYTSHEVPIHLFMQNRHPRIIKDTLHTMAESIDSPKECWYPPGHGDVFPALYNSGLIDQLMAEGKEYVFISNVDNLGATVDLKILKHLEDCGAEYVMEVTNKTRADVKGGTLIEYEGKCKLLEIAQVPPKHVNEFKSVKKFKIFNTNNLWVRLDAIKRVVESGALKDMDVIVNLKTVEEQRVIQLERAAGAAIEFFKDSHGVNVPRSRFLPVKSTADLFLAQSNVYVMKNGELMLNPDRPFNTVPIIKLGPEFQNVHNYLERFNGADVRELDHLTVSGDVTFGADVILRGTVIIVANHGCRIDIPAGSILENKIISGDLRILDH